MTILRSSLGCLVLSLLVLLGVVSPDRVRAGEIPIVIDRVLPDDRSLAPVRFGVPFPQGELQPGQVDSVRIVDDTNAAVPHQALVTATWDPKGEKGVRWLLIDTQVRRGRQYKLVYNQPDPAKVQAPANIATVEGDRIKIDAGAIVGELTTRGFNPFPQLKCLQAPLSVGPGEGQAGLGEREFSAFYVEHETKGIFRSDLDPEATVTLEENGPMRAVIKADGWYTNAAGEKFCRYSIRMHIVRGWPDLRIDHTWIYTGISKDDKLRCVSLQIRRTDAVQGPKVRGFTGDDDLRSGIASADFTGTCKIRQDYSREHGFELIATNANNDQSKFGLRGGGYLTTLGNQSTSMALRDAWQQAPWGMDIEQGVVRVHFWPPGEQLLDTTWDGFWYLLNDEQKRTGAATKPMPKDMKLDDWIEKLRQRTNATGAAKTHELYLSFMGPAYGAFREALPNGYPGLAREVAYPVLACADPVWMAQTRALDWMPQAPRDRETFRDEENFFDAMLNVVQDATAFNQWYGFWDWGGYHQHLYPYLLTPRPKTAAQEPGQGNWHRARPKSHYLWGGFSWLQFLRSGDRKWLRYAQTYTLYSADRAHTHHTGSGRKNGGEFHYDNSEVHWMGGYQRSPGGDQVASNLQAKDDYVYMYWMTGDRRALDVLKASADLICESGAYGEAKPGFSIGNEIRNSGMLLHRMCMAYQATWDERYRAKAEKIAAAFFPLTDVPKVAVAEKNPEVYFHSALGWAYEGMWFYLNCTGDERIRQPLQAFIDRGRQFGAGVTGCYSTSKALTYGFMLTQDISYLDLARAILDDHVSKGVEPYQFLPSGKMDLSGLPRVMGAMTVAPSEWQRANLPTHVRGRTINFRTAQFRTSENMLPVRAFIRESVDGAFSFQLVSMYGGRFVLYGPDGAIASEQTLDDGIAHWVKFDVPADGKTGDYMFVCAQPSELAKNNTNIEYQQLSRLVSCKWPITLEGLVPGQIDTFRARAFYFTTRGATEPVRLAVSDVDVRRPILITCLDQPWQWSNMGRFPGQGGSFAVTLPATPQGATFGIELIVPDVWLRVNRGRPRYITLTGAPHYVAANPEDLFIPVVPPVK